MADEEVPDPIKDTCYLSRDSSSGIKGGAHVGAKGARGAEEGERGVQARETRWEMVHVGFRACAEKSAFSRPSPGPPGLRDAPRVVLKQHRTDFLGSSLPSEKEE